jgi:hypothetical protein
VATGGERAKRAAMSSLSLIADHLKGRFVQERLRLKIIPNAFGEKPVLKLMSGAMIRAADR